MLGIASASLGGTAQDIVLLLIVFTSARIALWLMFAGGPPCRFQSVNYVFAVGLPAAMVSSACVMFYHLAVVQQASLVKWILLSFGLITLTIAPWLAHACLCPVSAAWQEASAVELVKPSVRAEDLPEKLSGASRADLPCGGCESFQGFERALGG